MANLVYGDGPIPSDVMLIGEAPGANEDATGKPFVGAAGKVLNAALEEAGLPRTSVYVTNMYKVRPPGNRTPTDKEIEEHAHILFGEFEAVSPKYVLLLGNTPLKFFMGKTEKISSRRGSRLKVPPMPEVFFYSTYHPAATIYNKTVLNDFKQDIKTFATIASGTYTVL